MVDFSRAVNSLAVSLSRKVFSPLRARMILAFYFGRMARTTHEGRSRQQRAMRVVTMRDVEIPSWWSSICVLLCQSSRQPQALCSSSRVAWFFFLQLTNRPVVFLSGYEKWRRLCERTAGTCPPPPPPWLHLVRNQKLLFRGVVLLLCHRPVRCGAPQPVTRLLRCIPIASFPTNT